MGSWFNYTIEKDSYVDSMDLLTAAVQFRQSIQSGASKAVAEQIVEEEQNNDNAPF